MNKINDNRFNTTDENNLASVYELISTYGMGSIRYHGWWNASSTHRFNDFTHLSSAYTAMTS
jgi:hypothetical protein